MAIIYNHAAFILALSIRWLRIYRTIVCFGIILDPWNTLTYYLVSRKKDIQRPRGGWKSVFSQYCVADDAYIVQILTNIKFYVAFLSKIWRSWVSDINRWLIYDLLYLPYTVMNLNNVRQFKNVIL